MGRPAPATPALETGHGARQTQLIAEVAAVPGRAMQRPIQGQRIVRGHHGRDLPAEVDGDLGGAERRQEMFVAGDPIGGDVVGIDGIRRLDQHDDRMGVRWSRIRQPEVLADLANSDLRGIEKITGALDVARASREIVRHRRLLGERLGLAQLFIGVEVGEGRVHEIRAATNLEPTGVLGPRGRLERDDRGIPPQFLERVRAELDRALFAVHSKHDVRVPVPCGRSAKKVTYVTN